VSQRTNRGISTRVWVVLGVGIAMVAGLMLLLAFLRRGPGPLSPMITPVTPTPTDDPVVASVNSHPIHHSFWLEATLLDQVMSGLSGQLAPTPEETLQRLINEELVLQAASPERGPTTEQVEAQIGALEQVWGVDDAAVVAALERAGLTRAALERAVERLLTVQSGLEVLESQGYESDVWLEEQRASAEIVFNDTFVDVVAAATAIPTVPSPVETPFVSPLPAPATETPTPSPSPVSIPAIPEVAPDFTLPKSGGGTFTLSEQLAQGPVVLVFFQRGGG